MSTITLINPATGAVTTSQVLVTDQFDSVVLHADNLAGAEEVDIYILGGQTETLFDNGTGTPIVLTASIKSRSLPVGPTYGIRKDATASACGVYASYKPATS